VVVDVEIEVGRVRYESGTGIDATVTTNTGDRKKRRTRGRRRDSNCGTESAMKVQDAVFDSNSLNINFSTCSSECSSTIFKEIDVEVTEKSGREGLQSPPKNQAPTNVDCMCFGWQELLT
jgi:uncharacterized phosphosugar-binding protein